jgi:citrate lyase subunit beta/citryl-CoA lyase
VEKTSAPRPRSPRSYLYVPGDRADHLHKARTRGADAIILDLEDAVTSSNKSLAREIVSPWLREQSQHLSAVWVRISAEAVYDDIQAISGPVAGIMVPRAEGPLLTEVERLLSEREQQLDLPIGSIAVIPLIETARGLLGALELAGFSRTVRLAIGRADLAGELGLAIDPEGVEFRTLLLQVVVASSAAGIAPPVAPTSTDFRDLESLKATTAQLSALGFRGRTAVHPAQLAVINEMFTPSIVEVDRARRLVHAFDQAAREGSGVTVDEDGRMVDAAVVRSARDILARAQES